MSHKMSIVAFFYGRVVYYKYKSLIFYMNFSQSELEHYSFLWSEARLAIAAVALFLGGTPPLLKILPVAPVGTLLTLAWLVSGAASCYLLYRWFQNDKKVFGGKESSDTAAFFVSVVSGINLGFVALLQTNIGMNISSSYGIFVLTAIIYLIAAWHLYQRWNASHQRIF